MICGKGFSWRFIAASFDPPSPEIIGNISCLINCKNTRVPRQQLEMQTRRFFRFLNLETLRWRFVVHVGIPIAVFGCARSRGGASFLTCGFPSLCLSPNHCNYSSNTCLFVCLLEWRISASASPHDQGGRFEWVSGEGHCG